MKITAYEKGEKSPAELFTQRQRGECVERVILKQTNHPDPNSRRQKCLAAGLHESAVNGYLLRHPDTTLTDDEIVAYLVNRRSTKTIAQLAREHGKNPRTVRHRIKKGMSLEEALDKPINTAMSRFGREGGKAKAEWGRTA